ncbi:MAG: hypothetical protein HQ551_09665 [Desulfobacteraceae bacterium]|nr:hypothetical protein [Desulfobacteraceae bacterium]
MAICQLSAGGFFIELYLSVFQESFMFSHSIPVIRGIPLGPGIQVGSYVPPPQPLCIPNHEEYRYDDPYRSKNPKQSQTKRNDGKYLQKYLEERIVHLCLECLDEKSDGEKTIDCRQPSDEDKLVRLLFLTLLFLTSNHDATR